MLINGFPYVLCTAVKTELKIKVLLSTPFEMNSLNFSVGLISSNTSTLFTLNTRRGCCAHISINNIHLLNFLNFRVEKKTPTTSVF